MLSKLTLTGNKNMSNTYWNFDSLNQELYNELSNKLIPYDNDWLVGPTIAGELLRSGIRVYFEGCQAQEGYGVNLTGPANYLIANLPIDNPISKDLEKISKMYNHYVSKESRESFVNSLEQLLDYVLLYVSNMDQTTPNAIDYWSLADIDGLHKEEVCFDY